jgi:uncharacterized protein
MRILGILLLFMAASSLFGQSEKCLPSKNPNQLVYDETGVLVASDIRKLDEKLIEFARNTSNQIVVVVVKDLCGYSPEQYATGLGDAWGVGQAKEDNGIVVLVKPIGDEGDRHVFIAVGRGLEGVITDVIAHRIIQNEMIPAFRRGDFYRGIDEATTVLMELAVGEYSSDDYVKRAGRRALAGIGIVLLIFLIAGIALMRHVKQYASDNHLSFWTALMLMNAANRSHRGSWGQFSGGRGGFGGFGGFGGGSFGGGGAGGRW